MINVSVIIATYNGKKYIGKQLESILNQSLKPDEIIVRDDCSTDNTLNIVRLIASHSDVPIKISSNKRNIGYANNFLEAIKLARGRYLFLADQDDVWLPNKICTILNAFNNSPHPLVVIHDQHLVDSDLNSLNETTLERFIKEKRPLSEFVHGCCTIFDAHIMPLVLKKPEGLAHDDWIHLIGVALNSRRIVSEPLQLFRRHDTNVTKSNMNSTNFVPSAVGGRVKIIRSPEQSSMVVRSLNKKLGWHLKLSALLDSLTENQLEGQILQFGKHNNNIIVKAIENRISNIARNSKVGVVKSYLAGEYCCFNGFRSMFRDLLSIV